MQLVGQDSDAVWRSVLPLSAMWPRSRRRGGRSSVFGLTWLPCCRCSTRARFDFRPDDLTADDELPRTVTSEQESEVFNRLGRVFKADDHYWTWSSPGSARSRAECWPSVADDLAEIYRDVKEGLNHLAAGGGRRAMLWQWRFGSGRTGQTCGRHSGSDPQVSR